MHNKNLEKDLNRRHRKVICLPEAKIFNSLKEASEYAGVETTTGITLACKFPFRIAGHSQKTNKPLRWMYYNEYQEKGDITTNKKVICLNTNEVFESMSEASAIYNVEDYKIGRSCLKIRKFSGIHPETKEKLMWMFFDEYNNLSEKELYELKQIVKKYSIIQKKGVDSYKYKVLCLTTGEKFKRTSDAAKKYNIDDRRIYDACNGILYSAGIHPETKEKLTWIYYKDYKLGKMTPAKPLGKKSVICISTGEIFRKINEASEKTNIPINHIRKAVLGKREFAGIDAITRQPLVWMFYSEYENDKSKEIQRGKIETANSPRLKLKVIREMKKYNLYNKKSL